jgi:hypothetical protein
VMRSLRDIAGLRSRRTRGPTSATLFDIDDVVPCLDRLGSVARLTRRSHAALQRIIRATINALTPPSVGRSIRAFSPD